MGVEFAGRGRRGDEAIRLMRALWSGDRRFEGRYWSFADATAEPLPSPPPDIWVGGSSARAIRRARELGDVWHPSRGSDPAHVRAVKEQHPDLRVIAAHRAGARRRNARSGRGGSDRHVPRRCCDARVRPHPPLTMLRIVPWLPPIFVDRAEAGRVLATSVAQVAVDAAGRRRCRTRRRRRRDGGRARPRGAAHRRRRCERHRRRTAPRRRDVGRGGRHRRRTQPSKTLRSHAPAVPPTRSRRVSTTSRCRSTGARRGRRGRRRHHGPDARGRVSLGARSRSRARDRGLTGGTKRRARASSRRRPTSSSARIASTTSPPSGRRTRASSRSTSGTSRVCSRARNSDATIGGASAASSGRPPPPHGRRGRSLSCTPSRSCRRGDSPAAPSSPAPARARSRRRARAAARNGTAAAPSARRRSGARAVRGRPARGASTAAA